MLRRKAGMAVAAAARVVPVAVVAVQVAAAAVQAVAAAPRVAVAVVRVQVAAVAAAAPAVRVAAAAARVEAVTTAAAVAVAVQAAGMLRAAALVEVRAEVSRIAAPATAVGLKVADVIVRVITTRRLLLVNARVIGTAIGTETATWSVIETGIETETVIVIERGIETETVIEAGKETLAAVSANGNAIASVTKTGGENVSVAAASIPRACICRRIMAAMDTAQTRMSKAIRTACTQVRTMRAGARVTIRAAHTFTSIAPAGFYPSSAVRLRIARPIAMVFCADMKRGTSATTCISLAGAFIGSACSLAGKTGALPQHQAAAPGKVIARLRLTAGLHSRPGNRTLPARRAVKLQDAFANSETCAKNLTWLYGCYRSALAY
jgi:hypothetical protein